MPNENHTCLSCGKRISYRFAICSSCETQYGHSPLEWPQWLRYLWNDEQRLRRQHKRIQENEVSFSDLPSNVAVDERPEAEDEDRGRDDGAN